MPVLSTGQIFISYSRKDATVTLRLITRQFVDLRQHEEERLTLLGTTLFAYIEKQNIEEGSAEGSQATSETSKMIGSH